MKRNYYEVLGITKSSNQDEIKKAYRKLAHQFHPDKGSGNEERFKEVNEAYQVLGDVEKRRQYDQFGRTFEGGKGFSGFQWGDIFNGAEGFDFQNGGGGFNVNDIFENIFGFGRSREASEKKGRDVLVELAIPFEESILGGRRRFEVTRTAQCSRCSGSGAESGSKTSTCSTCKGHGSIQRTERTILGSITRVEICRGCQGRGKTPEKPCTACKGAGLENKREAIELEIHPGVSNGESLRVPGKGSFVSPDGGAGDLYVHIKVQPHRVFTRNGQNLLMSLPLKLSQAVLGDTVKIETIDGSVSVKIPEGSESGDILQVKGRGVPHGRHRGDLLIHLHITTPKRVPKHVQELIERLRTEGY